MHATARMRNAGRGTRRRTRNHLCLAARIRLQVGGVGAQTEPSPPSRVDAVVSVVCVAQSFTLQSIPNTGSGMNHHRATTPVHSYVLEGFFTDFFDM
jgi:hypothetical protein